MANESPKTDRDILQGLITKSEEEFEKKLTYIGAGALLLSLTLLEKIFKLEQSTGMIYLIFSWILLIISLLVNFISHLVSKIHLRKAQQEIDSSFEIGIRIKHHKRRLIHMEFLNWSSAISLVFGIVLILIFASVNAIKTHNRVKTPKEDTIMVKIINQKQIIMKPLSDEKPEERGRQNEGYTYPTPEPIPERRGFTYPEPRQEPEPAVTPQEPPKTTEKK
jgi:hypothetical protein